jgi:hypothetical protein
LFSSPGFNFASLNKNRTAASGIDKYQEKFCQGHFGDFLLQISDLRLVSGQWSVVSGQ